MKKKWNLSWSGVAHKLYWFRDEQWVGQVCKFYPIIQSGAVQSDGKGFQKDLFKMENNPSSDILLNLNKFKVIHNEAKQFTCILMRSELWTFLVITIGNRYNKRCWGGQSEWLEKRIHSTFLREKNTPLIQWRHFLCFNVLHLFF